MISSRYKFIYIHIPKTGGNSIQAALEPYADDRLVFRPSVGSVVAEDGEQGLDVFNDTLGFDDPKHKHASLQDYFEALGDEIRSYFIFTSIRNPWDRVISQTAFLTPEGVSPRVLRVDELILPLPMRDYIWLDDKPGFDDVIRFESLQADFDRVCRRIGIACHPLPHKNRSRRDGYKSYYDDVSRAYVGERFKQDIELFEYGY